MRITFWSETLPPALSGISTYLGLLWSWLHQRGFQLALVGRSEGLSGPAIPELGGPPGWISQLRLPFFTQLQRPDPAGLGQLQRQLKAFWSQHPPDLVHICSPGHPSLFFLLPLLQHTPLVLSLHDHHPELNYTGQQLPARVLQRARRILCRSQHLADDLLQRVPSLQGKVQVVHHGLPPAPPQAEGVVQRQGLLYAGRLAPEKGFDLLLQTLPALRSRFPGLQLTVAGDGPLRDPSQGVRWLGPLSPQQLRLQMQQAALLVVPSRREALGLVALEAAQCGLPVVAARVGGLTEIVQHDLTGLLVDPDSPAALTEAIASLLDDPQRCEQLGQAARQHIASAFPLQAMLSRHETTYRELLS
jgi:glycosyltransferase involved in cell wall biosynthesis